MGFCVPLFKTKQKNWREGKIFFLRFFSCIAICVDKPENIMTKRSRTHCLKSNKNSFLSLYSIKKREMQRKPNSVCNFYKNWWIQVCTSRIRNLNNLCIGVHITISAFENWFLNKLLCFIIRQWLLGHENCKISREKTIENDLQRIERNFEFLRTIEIGIILYVQWASKVTVY